MDRWYGVPTNLDAATTTPSGKTYFFKGNYYWLYNNERATGQVVLRCDERVDVGLSAVFAYFEWALSQVAAYFDPAMLVVTNLNYSSTQTVLFQRGSVIVTDIVFAFGVKRCMSKLAKTENQHIIGSALLLSNIGLLMVDHIHFQYNGFLFGFLLLSLSFILTENYLASALCFAVLLNLKHIFIYVAPVYVLFARLFPFKRGLTHAYWAPNFWALYNFADKVLSIVLGRKSAMASGTGGLVQTFDHTVLPSISPTTTFVMTAVAMFPTLYKLWTLKNTTNLAQNFIRAVTMCACSSFMFGWHVHEKAILMVIIPLTVLSITNRNDARWTLFLGILGHYSLFPLLFSSELILIKHAMHVVYTGISVLLFRNIHGGRFLSIPERLYLYGFVFLSLFENIIHPALNLEQTLPFIPLMATSVYSALGVSYFWLNYQKHFITQTPFLTKDQGVSKTKKN
ncbi:hypothetical protein quinque_012268 [Culex quinquefasciatus]